MSEIAESDEQELANKSENPPTPEDSPQRESKDPVASYDQGRDQTRSKPNQRENTENQTESVQPNLSDSQGRHRIIQILHWLRPTPTEQGRTGFISTYDELKVFLLGICIGVGIPTGGMVEIVSALLAGGVAGTRIVQGLPAEEIEIIKREIPHFILGLALSYASSIVVAGEIAF